MNRGDLVKIKSTGKIGVIEFEQKAYTTLLNGHVVEGYTPLSILVKTSEGTIERILKSDDDLEVIEQAA